MTTLEQDLPIIEAAASELPGNLPAQVVEVLGESREYRQKVDAYLAFLEQKGMAADALLDRVEKALQALKAQASGEQPELEKALKEVDEEVEEALGVQETEEKQLSSAVDAAGKVMGELKDKLQEAGRRAHQAQEKATSEMEEVGGGLVEGQDVLDTAVKGVVLGADQVQAQIVNAGQTMEKTLDAVKGKMAEYQDYVEARVGDAQVRLSQLAGDHANARREAMEGLLGHSAAISIALREALQAQQAQVSKAMAEVGEAIAGVSAALDTASTDAETKCEELDGPAALLGASVPFMDALVDKVKEAAASLTQLQVSWPH